MAWRLQFSTRAINTFFILELISFFVSTRPSHINYSRDETLLTGHSQWYANDAWKTDVA